LGNVLKILPIKSEVKNIKDPKIVIVGASYKTDTSDTRESPAAEVIKILKQTSMGISHFDPLVDKPKKKCKCSSSSFEGENDVMDTWATSSVTPQIILNWAKDGVYDLEFKKLYPCSLRPQAHDIIRTWAFYTVVKGIYHNDEVPWKNIVISGHVLDPKGEAMHKSKGNVIEPAQVLDKFSADALRFWAAGSKLGDDLRYLEKDLLTGQRTINKLWNAYKFCKSHFGNYKLKK